MFSSRVPADRRSNRLARAVAQLRERTIAFLDLTASNPTRAGLRYPPGLLDTLADPAGVEYAPEPFGLQAARRAVAETLTIEGRALPWERVILTASTSEAYSLLFKLLCNPGDRVLAPRPSYPLVEFLTRLDGVGLDYYDLDYLGRWEPVFESLDAGITPATRAILVVNPNNPTGSYLTRPELERIGELAVRRRLALIGDEVFHDYALPEKPADTVSILDQPAALAFSLGGLSKAAALPQLKLGWIGVAGPPPLVDEALGRLEVICDSYLSAGTPVQLAAGSLIRQGREVRAQIASRTAANLDRLRAAVASRPAVSVLRVEGGWYAVLQVPAVAPEETLVLDLLERERVLVHPGYFYDFPREAYLVLSLLPPPEEFAEGTRRLMTYLTVR